MENLFNPRDIEFFFIIYRVILILDSGCKEI